MREPEDQDLGLSQVQGKSKIYRKTRQSKQEGSCFLVAILICLVITFLLQLRSLAVRPSQSTLNSEIENKSKIELQTSIKTKSGIIPEPQYKPIQCKAFSMVPILKPVAYIWLGGSLPQNHYNQLIKSTVQFVLYGDVHWNTIAWRWQKYTSLTLQEKTEILKWLILYNYGGIYSDFGIYCDYGNLLMNLPLKGCYFAAQEEEPSDPFKYNGQFVYCAQKGDQQIKLILKSLEMKIQGREKAQSGRGVQINGPIQLANPQRYNVFPKYLSVCIKDFRDLL